MKYNLFHFLYVNLVKKIFFLFDPEFIHDVMVYFGSLLGNYSLTRYLTSITFKYQNLKLEKEVLGIKFANPIGLSAGFDYDGNLVKILPELGFGFATVGTTTFLPYEGNPKPRLTRLIKSKSILVNKGFKSQGVHKVAKRLNDPSLKDIVFGVSVGSSNVPEVCNIDKAIEDYIASFNVLEQSPYIKYYELNISCPNTCLTENFMIPENLKKLLDAVTNLGIKRPIFIKMPNVEDTNAVDALVEVAMHHGFSAFIFSNLVKNRESKFIHPDDKQKMIGLKGNMSGKPTEENSNFLLRRYREKYGKDITLIGVGGVFSYEDAKKKLDAGADLVQLITGMIYEGPELIGMINSKLVEDL